MYFVFVMLYASNPAFLLLGMLGVFGKKGEEAANDMAMGLGIILAVVVVGLLIYGGLSLIGIV